MPEASPLSGRLVRLEPMSPDHAPGLLAAATEDRGTYGFTCFPADAAAVGRYIERAGADGQTGLAVTYTLESAYDGRVAGTSRLRDLEYWHAGVWPPRPGHLNPDGMPDAGQIGSTRLVPWAQRTGMNAEAKFLATFEGVRRAHFPAADGGVRDWAMYSLVRADWPHVKELLGRRLARHAPMP